VEENPEVITDIARKTGTTEDEARAIYHLTEAERLLSVIHSDVTKDLGTIVSIRQHFDALYSSLACGSSRGIIPKDGEKLLKAQSMVPNLTVKARPTASVKTIGP
jgi:hypothetical protein